MAREQTVGVIVKASDLLSRANALIKASYKPSSRGPIAKRPPAARKTVGGKKPCRIA